MGIGNVIFIVLAASVFGFFAYSLRKTWVLLKTTGTGTEEDRTSHPMLRLKAVFEGGFLQKKNDEG